MNNKYINNNDWDSWNYKLDKEVKQVQKVNEIYIKQIQQYEKLKVYEEVECLKKEIKALSKKNKNLIRQVIGLKAIVQFLKTGKI